MRAGIDLSISPFPSHPPYFHPICGLHLICLFPCHILSIPSNPSGRHLESRALHICHLVHLIYPFRHISILNRHHAHPICLVAIQEWRWKYGCSHLSRNIFQAMPAFNHSLHPGGDLSQVTGQHEVPTDASKLARVRAVIDGCERHLPSLQASSPTIARACLA